MTPLASSLHFKATEWELRLPVERADASWSFCLEEPGDGSWFEVERPSFRTANDPSVQMCQAGDVNIAPVHCCRISNDEDACLAALKSLRAPPSGSGCEDTCSIRFPDAF